MISPRGAHTAARLRDGRVLIVGGVSRGRVVATTEIFDPRTGRFERGPRLDVPRSKAGSVTLGDGRVLVVGGEADVDGARTLATTEIYDPRTNRFVAGPVMRHPRVKLAGALVRFGDGDVLVAGGGAAPELLDRRTGRFRVVRGTPGGTPRLLTATRIGVRRALLIGGYDAQITPTAQTWLYR